MSDPEAFGAFVGRFPPRHHDLLIEARRTALDKFGSVALRALPLVAERKGPGADVPISARFAAPDGDRRADVRYLTNIVFQGGGVLGAAHVGFLAGLEAANVRALGLAGASAGSIIALGGACARGGDPLATISDKIYPLLATIPMSQFVDGPRPTRQLIASILNGDFRRLRTVGRVQNALAQFTRYKGLNPGDAFQDWLARELERPPFNVRSIDDLYSRLKNLHATVSSIDVEGVDGDHGLMKSPVTTSLLALTASGIPAGIKIVLPRELDLFDIELAKTSPALLARASMAVPFFFEPVDFDVNDQWPDFVRESLSGLVDRADLEAVCELTALSLVDGGVFSNLPTDAFDDVTNGAPTLAVTLVSPPAPQQRRSRGGLRDAIEHAGVLINAARYQRDRDTVIRQRRNRDDKQRLHVVAISTGRHNWLNFFLDEADVDDLFRIGLRRAIEFLNEEDRPQA